MVDTNSCHDKDHPRGQSRGLNLVFHPCKNIYVVVYTYRKERLFAEAWRMSHASPFEEYSTIFSFIDYLPYSGDEITHCVTNNTIIQILFRHFIDNYLKVANTAEYFFFNKSFDSLRRTR